MKKEFTMESTTQGQVSVKIMADGSISIKGLGGNVDRDTDIDSAMSIWKMYKSYRSNDIVIRSGSGLCGVYPYDPKQPTLTNYVENDTLHSTTVEELAQNVFRFYPGLFNSADQTRIIHLLRYHDLGETVDNPDDGSKDHDEKFEEELATFISKISYLVPAAQEQLIRDFIMFENADYLCWDEESKKMMQFAKLCDKADAPLGAFVYESQGRHGSLTYKKEHFGGITDQDEKYAQEIGDYSQAGIWTAHMIDTYGRYKYIEIFIEIIIAACKDIRGEIFPWMREFCKKRRVPNYLLDKM